MARIVWHDAAVTEEFTRVRKAAGMVEYLERMGTEWVAELNAELRAAQAKRKQPVEDGYEYRITTGGSRARLYIVAATARAQAHEAKNGSILKLMRTSGHDVKATGRQFVNPTKGWLVHGTDDNGDPIHGLD